MEEGDGSLPSPPRLTSEPVPADAQEPPGAAAQRVPLPISRGPLPAGSLEVAPGSPPAAASLPHGAGPAGDLPAGGVRRAHADAPGAGARRLALLLPGLERRRLFVPASGQDHLRIVPATTGVPRRRGGAGGGAQRGGSPTPRQGPEATGRRQSRRARPSGEKGRPISTPLGCAATAATARSARLATWGRGRRSAAGRVTAPAPPLRPAAHARAAPQPGGREEPLLPPPPPCRTCCRPRARGAPAAPRPSAGGARSGGKRAVPAHLPPRGGWRSPAGPRCLCLCPSCGVAIGCLSRL